MASRAACALLLTCLPVAGCGTTANLVLLHPAEGGKTPFGGVRHDLSHVDTQAKQGPEVATRLLCTADLPFSFIGDVVTWPYTAAYSFINAPIPLPPPMYAPGGSFMPPAAALGQPETMEKLPQPGEMPKSR